MSVFGVRINPEESRIEVPFEGFVPASLADSTKLIPGRRQTSRGYEWGFSREVLERLLLDLHLAPIDGAQERLWQLRQLPPPDPSQQTPLLIDDDHLEGTFPWFATTRGLPHQFRFKAWRRGYGLDQRLHRACLLEAGKGLGKTLSAIEEMLELFERRPTPRILVLARNANLVTVWQEQIETHAAGLPFTILRGPRLLRQEAMATLLDRGAPHVFVHNHEDLPAMGRYLARATEWDMVVIDESSRFRNATARRTGLLTGFRSVELRADTKLALSGLPMIKRTTDLYPTLKWLGAPVGNKAEFEDRFLVMGGYGDHEEIAIKDVAGLNLLLDHYRFVVPKGTVLNLPRRWHYELIDLKPWQKESYARVRKELKTRFLDPATGKVSEKLVTLRLEEMLRLTQITAGFEAIDTDRYNWRDDNAKTEHLLNEVLPEFEGEKVVLWAHYHAEIRELVKLTRARGWRSVGYFGGHPGTQTQIDTQNDQAYKDFTRGGANLFVANTAMGSTGLNLPMAPTMIFYTRTFNTEDWQQALDRNSRLSTAPDTVLNVVVLEAAGTNDQTVTRVLGDDMRRASQVTALDVAEMLGIAS